MNTLINILNISKLKLVLFALLLFSALNLSYSQEISVKAAFDSTAILIGDQIFFTISVEQPSEAKVEFPVLQDSIISKIEIVSQLPADTSFTNLKTIRVTRKYLITSFDSGDYKIDFLKFPYKLRGRTDTVLSNALMLYVRAIPIKDANKIADIKGVIEIPFTFKEALPYIAWGLGGILLIVLLAYVYLRWKQKKPIFGLLEKPADPPHVTALRDLEKLKSEKLWQQGFYKQYYSRLTDIIRAYIEGRIKIPALESTTDEILGALRGSDLIDNSLQSELKEMLSVSDLVKFAKAEPLADENENAWRFANDFIMKTYKDPVVDIDEVETEESAKDN